MQLIIGLLIAAAGGLLFYKLKVPAGAMIGALAFVAIYNIITGSALFPDYIKTCSQILTGTYIGLSIRGDVVRLLKALIIPAAMIAVFLMAAGILIGYLIYFTTDFDLVTCLLSTAPGGIVDMSLIGMDMGADTSKMAMFHLVRLLGIICIWPPLSRIILKKAYKVGARGDNNHVKEPGTSVSDVPEQAEKPLDKPETRFDLKTVVMLNAVTIGVGAVGGMVGYFLNIPAGVMLFSMIAVGIMNIKTGRAYMTGGLRRAAQIAAGAMVGQSFGFDQLLSIGKMIVPALTIILCYLVISVFFTYFLYKNSGLDLISAIYSGLPAGAAEMSLIAADMGADGPQVAILHMSRLVLVIALYPQIVYMLVR